MFGQGANREQQRGQAFGVAGVAHLQRRGRRAAAFKHPRIHQRAGEQRCDGCCLRAGEIEASGAPAPSRRADDAAIHIAFAEQRFDALRGRWRDGVGVHEHPVEARGMDLPGHFRRGMGRADGERQSGFVQPRRQARLRRQTGSLRPLGRRPAAAFRQPGYAVPGRHQRGGNGAAHLAWMQQENVHLSLTLPAASSHKRPAEPRSPAAPKEAHRAPASGPRSSCCCRPNRRTSPGLGQ